MTDGNTDRTRAARAVVVDELPGASRAGGKTYRCQVNLIRREHGFLAVAAALPGVVGIGASEADALAEITEAFKTAIKKYTKGGRAIPWSDPVDLEPGWVTRWVFPEL